MILDDVLGVLDMAGERLPASAVAAVVGDDELSTEAAIYALLDANLCGEEPGGYYFTDARDPAYKERNA